MKTPASPDDLLAHRLALDVCEQWKMETGRNAQSVDDLKEVKQWMATSRATVSSFPALQILAIQGINTLIARHSRHGTVGAN